MEKFKPEDLKRRVEEQPFDPHATKDAVNLLNNMRMKYANQIPMAAWKMMHDAEEIMNKELDSYFKPTEAKS